MKSSCTRDEMDKVYNRRESASGDHQVRGARMANYSHYTQSAANTMFIPPPPSVPPPPAASPAPVNKFPLYVQSTTNDGSGGNQVQAMNRHLFGGVASA